MTRLPFQVTHVARLKDRHIAVTDTTGAVWAIPLVDGAEPNRLMEPFKSDGLTALDDVACLAVSWDGTFVARASRAGVVDILRFGGDAEHRLVRIQIPTREGEPEPVNRRMEVTEAAIDRDGNILLSTNSRVLWHWRPDEGTWRSSSVESSVGSVAALSFCTNSHAAVSAHATVGLVLWTLSGPFDPSALMRSAEGLQPRAMSIAGDGEQLVIGSQSSGVVLYSANDIQWGRFIHRCDRPVIAHGITTAPRLICVISMDRKVQVLRLEPDPDTDRREPVLTFPGGAVGNDVGAPMSLVSSGETGPWRIAIEDQDTLLVFRVARGADERIGTFRCDVRLDSARLAGSYVDVETQGGERLAFMLHPGRR